MEETRRAPSNKPLQMLSWSEKIAKDKEYFKSTADFYLSQGVTSYNSLDAGKAGELKTFYEVYNNQVPEKWFNHITDPLSAKDSKHKNFPAKIRPTNILRTNIDRLLSEWMRRPFKYHTESLGEDGYNRYTDQLNKTIENNLVELFTSYAVEEIIAQGGTEEDLRKLDPASIPIPPEVKEKFQATYRDKIAIQAQKWLERAIQEYHIKRVLHKGFKDWLIGGEVGSYKGIHNGELIYQRLSPMFLNYDKSSDVDFVEDAEWATYTWYMTISDIVDMFYKDLKDKDVRSLENHPATKSPSAFYSYFEGLQLGTDMAKIPVQVAVWKGKKKVIFVDYKDPLTGESQSFYGDEAEEKMLREEYGSDAITIEWHNEVYETWRIGGESDKALYVRMQPVEAQRNSMNNLSRTKLPINAKKYSDLHAKNISIVQIGIPYLIMYMIVGRTLELTIAKSKGKILMMDNNAIPRTNGWNEERFFYYSEALGYGLLNRNQIGVDKSWNQYHVIDMSLFDQIQQLILLQQHYKREWDDALGINDSRKGMTNAEDSGVKVQAEMFQSTIVTDMIFIGFDEFVERELQGLIDLSKFTNIDGVRRLYNSDLMRDEILEIDPNEYVNADIGVFILDGLEDSKVLDAMKMQAPQLAQAGVRGSTLLEIFQAQNIASLRTQLKAIEAIEDQIAENQQISEQEAQAEADQRKMAFMEWEKALEEQLINTEYDRKEDLEVIKGENNILSYGQGADEDNDGVPDAVELLKAQGDRDKLASEERRHARDLVMKERLENLKNILTSRDKAAERQSKERMKDKELAVKLRTERIKARAKPKTAK